MSEYEAICFDLDGTLWVDDRDWQTLHEAVFERVGVEPSFEPADVDRVEFGSLPAVESDEALWTAIYERAARIGGGDGTHADRLGEAIVTEFREGPFRVRDGATELLRRFAERYELGVVTNASPEIARRRYERSGLPDVFGTRVYCGVSTDVPRKPDPEPFERVVDALGVAPEEALFVGNSIEADVVGAQAAGLDDAWLPVGPAEDPEPRPTHRLDRLVELRDVVAGDA